MNIRVAIPIIAVLAIGVIVAGVSCQSGELKEAQSTIVALEADLAAAETKVSTLDTDLAAAEAGVSALETELAAAEARISALKAQASTLDTDLAAAEAGVSALETELAAAEARISALEAELAADQSANEVEILDFLFIPDLITVPGGTTVTWTNLDVAGHTTTSDTDVWKSKMLFFNGTFSYTFTEPGTYPYYCVPHLYMIGTVIVE